MTSVDEERVLAGRAPLSSELTELAEFARSVRTTLLVEPDPVASTVLVGRLAAAARASATASAKSVAWRRPRRAVVARIAVAAALLPLFLAGLALAGVSLPGPAQSAFESVGIELPNQSGEGGSADKGTGSAGQDAAGPEDAQQPASAPSGGSAGESRAESKDANGQGAGRLKSNPAREQGRGNGTQGRGRAIGKLAVPPGYLNPNGGGQGNGTAVGKTDGTPPGYAEPRKAPIPKPPTSPPGAGKLNSN